MEKYFSVIIVLLCFLQMSCFNTTQNESLIDYSTLPEMEIDIDLKIEESESFLPGRLQDLIITEDGSLIISDLASMSIVQFERDGSFKRVIAERGQGPGELTTFFSLIDSKRDTLLVKYIGMSGQIDVYSRDEIEDSYLYQYSLNTEIENNRRANIIEAAPEF